METDLISQNSSIPRSGIHFDLFLGQAKPAKAKAGMLSSAYHPHPLQHPASFPKKKIFPPKRATPKNFFFPLRRLALDHQGMHGRSVGVMAMDQRRT